MPLMMHALARVFALALSNRLQERPSCYGTPCLRPLTASTHLCTLMRTALGAGPRGGVACGVALSCSRRGLRRGP